VERSDVIVGILTTRVTYGVTSSDYVLIDGQTARLRARSCFRAYLRTLNRSNVTVIGHLSERDWSEVKARMRIALAE